MDSGSGSNYVGGEWRPARRGARFPGPSGRPEDAWSQSGSEDVLEAAAAARRAAPVWRGLAPGRRRELLAGLAQALEEDERLRARVAERVALEPALLVPHTSGLVHALRAPHGPSSTPGAAWPELKRPGIAWCVHDWSELLRAPLEDVAQALLAGQCVVLLSDARMPELCEHFALAAGAAGLPPGVLGVLHGARRELLALGLGLAEAQDDVLVASGLADQMLELRHLEARSGVEARLRALRAGVFEVETACALERSAEEVVERAFGRGTTLGGQLPGALGRVYCPAHLFSRFSECFLERLEESLAVRTPVPLFDDDAVARARAALELGLDEGATCVAGGDVAAGSRVFAPTVFSNVEAYMASARRQDPLPILCLLRG